MCDIALRSAADSGMNVTGEADARFKEVIQTLHTSSSHSGSVYRLDVPLVVYERMKIAKRKDSVERKRSHVKSDVEWRPTMTINFVLLQSPLLSPHDPETVILSLPIHPFRRFFGTSVVIRVVHVSPSSRTLTSICAALQMRAHIRLNFGASHFKTYAEYLKTMPLFMYSSTDPAVCSLLPNANSGYLATCGH
ncbi:hypothetical protein H4582DRAFT_268116 [Lactarius indigo]|nr:hypothetical protein H4582DRAFT_268116 [Lactarius indigo]